MNSDSYAKGYCDHDEFDDAENFYFTVRRKKDLQEDTYSDARSLFDSNEYAIEKLSQQMSSVLSADSWVLIIGGGYGGAAGYLAKQFGCHVVAVNPNSIENEHHRRNNATKGLTKLIKIIDCDYKEIPYPDSSFDVVIFQDAVLNTGENDRIPEEAPRVLKSGGEFFITNPILAEDSASSLLGPIVDRVYQLTMMNAATFQQTECRFGCEEIPSNYLDKKLVTHYATALERTEQIEAELEEVLTTAYIEQVKEGLKDWTDQSESNYLAWCAFSFRKQ
jgi:sarcosine/dimethylglycine N-methyltransferase